MMTLQKTSQYNRADEDSRMSVESYPVAKISCE